MSSSFPSVSVVIPVKNEAANIKACIEGILSQSIPVLEIIVIDSGSTDNTVAILKTYEKVRIIEIPASEFNHGATRNLGVSYVRGEFCLLTVGDARAADDDWIKKMLKCFENETIAAVCGAQVVPHDADKNPVEWFRPVSRPEISKFHFPSATDFDQLSAQQKKEVCSWDDVNALYRTRILKEIPFQKTSFAEDALWAKDALRAGYSIIYNPAARVYHYHLENPDFTFKRSFTVLYYRYKFFGHRPEKGKNAWLNRLRIIKTLLKEKRISLREKWKWWKYNNAMHHGIEKAIAAFNDAIDKGELHLDTIHQELCGKPPIPGKK